MIAASKVNFVELEQTKHLFTCFSSLLCSVHWFIQIQTLLLPFSKALCLKAFPAIDSCLTQSSLQLKLLYKLNTFPGPLIYVSAFKYVFLCWKKNIQNILSPSNWEPQNKQQKEMFRMTAYLLQKTELWSA